MNKTLSRILTLMLLLIISLFLILSLRALIRGEKREIIPSSSQTEKETHLSPLTRSQSESHKVFLPETEFSRLFPMEYKAVPKAEPDAEPEPVAATRSLKKNHSISFVGTLTDGSGIENYYFKNDKSGRVLKLAPGETLSGWNLKEVNTDHFILKIEETLYEIPR